MTSAQDVSPPCPAEIFADQFATDDTDEHRSRENSSVKIGVIGGDKAFQRAKSAVVYGKRKEPPPWPRVRRHRHLPNA
jgi:hypothetical protein